MVKKTEAEIKREEQLEIYEAALLANQEIQEGSMGGLIQGASPMSPPGGGSHLIPLSQNLGAGGTGFQDGNQTRAVKNMREADKAYREIGLVRNVVDIMTDFTAEGLNVHHPVAAQERFYRAWLKKVQMDEIAKQSLRGMYKWANVGIFRFWGKIRPKTRKEMMAKARELFAQGKDKEAIKAFFREDHTVKRGRIPIRYSCLPPFRVRITGSLLFDTRHYNYALAENDRMKLLEPEKYMDAQERYLAKEIPESLKHHIQKDARIPLPPEHFTMLHYKRDCSRLWADPIILPIMNDLRFKQVLRRMDISVAESIINPITIFKLGDTVNGFGPTKEQFQNLANLLKTPVATKTLVWSDLIEVEQHIVDAKEVFSMEKYGEVDLDILNGLGVSLTLINGGAGSAGGGRGVGAQAFLSVRTLIERLEDGRQEFMKFLNVELEFIRKAMGWKRAPKVTWDQMNLRDEAARERIMIELRDRKIISNETLLDMFDLDNDIEMSRKKREEKAGDRSDTTVSVGPFEEQVRVQNDEDPARLGIDQQDKQLEQNAEFKDKDIEHQTQMAKEAAKLKPAPTKNTSAPKSGPGRPAGKGDPSSRKQKKKRDTKPQGQGSVSGEPIEQDLIEVALSTRAVIDHYLKPRYLESLGKENLRQLTKDEKNTYNKLIERIWAQSSPYAEEAVSTEWVELIADMVVSGDSAAEIYKHDDGTTAHTIYGSLVGEYRADNHKFPSERISRELFAKALVIFNK